jgi:hypothetical protein
MNAPTPNGKKKVDAATAQLVDNDDVLKHLLDVTAIGKKQKLICDYYFHDTIMETTLSSDEIERLQSVRQGTTTDDSSVAASEARGQLTKNGDYR